MATQDITIPKKEIAPGVFTTGGVATIPQNTPASATISAQDLKPQTPINLTGTFQQPTDMGTGLVASGDMIQQDIQKYLDATNQPQTETQSLYDQLIGSVSTASEGLTGRGASQTQAEQQTGFTQANKELADLNAQYLSKKAEYDKLNANIEAGAGRQGLTTSQMTGQQGAVNRAAAADLGLLQAQILGKQGQVEQAQNAANRAVDLMYQDREAVYNTKLKQLELIKDKLTGEEAKQAKALEYALNKEQKALEEEKQVKKDIQTLSLKARENGAPNSVINAISNAKNFEEAVIAIGRYIREPAKASGPVIPTIKSINGVDMQWDAASGKWVTPTGVTGSAADTTQDTLNKFKFIRDTAKEADRLADASGQSGIRRQFGNVFQGDSKYNQLEAYVNTLKTNMLTLATDPNIKKFFGPQMSNADVELMVSAGTTLNPKSQSDKQLRAEIKRIDDFINRAQTAVQTGQSGGNVMTAPDGTVIEIID